MDYKEILQVEEAFKSFLIQQKKQGGIKITYYCLSNGVEKHHCSYVGYQTTNHGLHGIHYNLKKNQYYFGTKNKRIPSTLAPIFHKEISKIP